MQYILLAENQLARRLLLIGTAFLTSLRATICTMTTYSSKAQEGGSRVISASSANSKSSAKQAPGFINNRPEAVAQRKLQAALHTTARASQRAVQQGTVGSATSGGRQAAPAFGKFSLPIQRVLSGVVLPDTKDSVYVYSKEINESFGIPDTHKLPIGTRIQFDIDSSGNVLSHSITIAPGLNSAESVEEFSTYVAGQAQEWKNKNSEQKKVIIQNFITAKFTSLGIPPPTIVSIGSEGRNGEFNSSAWSFGMSEKALNNPIEDSVATAYHEARHAEQYFLIARYITQNRLEPPHSHQIPPRVLDKALKAAPLLPAEYREAEGFYQSIFGVDAKKRNYTLTQVGTHTQAVFGQKIGIMNHAKAAYDTAFATAKQYMDAHKATVTSAGGAWPDEQQKVNIRVKNEALVVFTQARQQAIEAERLFKESQNAYLNLPEEKDAHRFGDLVREAVKAKL